MFQFLKQNGFKLVMLVAALGAFAWRIWLLDFLFGKASGCPSCVVEATMISDAPMLTAWALILWLGCSVQRPWIGRSLRLLSVLVLVIYLVDIYVLQFFLTRPRIPWLLSYGATPGLVLEQVLKSGMQYFIMLILAASMAVIALVFSPAPRASKPALALSVIGALFLLSSVVAKSNQLDYVGAWAIENIFLTNHDFSGTTARYSNGFLDQARQETAPIPSCRAGDNLQRDLIVLILESWSPYQSRLWGGGRNWTPNLDRLARESMRADRLIAGGFHTHHGLMSILTGIPLLAPMTSPAAQKPFEPAWGWPYTLPRQLGQGGYRTAFLTSGDLSLTHKRDWIDHIGFQYVEGHDFPGYDGLPRSHFRSAPDGALFDRAADYWEGENSPGSPLAIVVESVSMHTPFIHPVTRAEGEEGVVQYVDQAVADFHSRLADDGFFDQGGILLVASDHRAMTFLGHEEEKRFGASARALIPLFIMGDPPGEGLIAGLRHQSDITPSLAAFLTEEGCGFPGWESLFSRTTGDTDRCVFNMSGNSVEKVDVFCRSGHGTVELDGDDSRFTESTGIGPRQQSAILGQIAVFRVASQQYTDRQLREGRSASTSLE